MGKQPLTQEEVDALLKGLFDDEIETEAAEKTGAEGVVPYDLFSQDHFEGCPGPFIIPTAEVGMKSQLRLRMSFILASRSSSLMSKYDFSASTIGK